MGSDPSIIQYQENPSVAETGTLIESLQDQLNQVSTDCQDLIEAQVESLREIALLNRFADQLVISRTADVILSEAGLEVASLMSAERAWVFEWTRNQQQWLGVEIFNEQIIAKGLSQVDKKLPAEVKDLLDDMTDQHLSSSCMRPAYSPDEEGRFYVSLPIISRGRLCGLVIVQTENPQIAGDSSAMRLCTSLLCQVASGVENAQLFQSMKRMIIDVVVAFALAIESRDAYTGGHVTRVTAYSMAIGEKLKLSDEMISRLRLGGMLHDIGKIAVPDVVLNKPGRLTDEEFAIMKSHAAVGDAIVRPIPQLRPLADIVRHHHERFDGRGYPDGLAGQGIPYLARITAVADTFDAMTSDRPYRKGLPYDVAYTEIVGCKGTQFDPDIADVFLSLSRSDLERWVLELKSWQQCGPTGRGDFCELQSLLDASHDHPERGVKR